MHYQHKYESLFLSTIYDCYHHNHIAFVDFLKNSCPIGLFTKILDVGCGTGNETTNIRNSFRCDVIGIDTSKNMLEKAQEKSTEVEWIEASAEHLPIQDKSIDIVTCFFSYHHFQDKVKAIKEFLRVLKHNGILIITTITHEQIMNCYEYKYFPQLLENDIKRVPDSGIISETLTQHGFQVEISEVPYEKRIIDQHYIDMIRNRYRSGLSILSNEEIEHGIKLIREDVNEKPIIDDINCTIVKGTLI